MFGGLALLLTAPLFKVAKMVENLPAMWETWVQSLGQEDSKEKGMATHSSTLAWKIPWTEEPGGLQSKGSHTETKEEQSRSNSAILKSSNMYITTVK